MLRRLTLVFAGLALLIAALAPTRAMAQADDARRALNGDETAVLRLINAYRAQHGAGPLTATRLLNQVAADHSADMAARGYFNHVTPEGRSPFDRMNAAGYDAGAMGENLAAGHADAAATFEQWRTSPAHNAAMLNDEYRAVGIGRIEAPGTVYRYYWTTVFGDDVDASAITTPAAIPATTVAAAPAPSFDDDAAGDEAAYNDDDSDEAAPAPAPVPARTAPAPAARRASVPLVIPGFGTLPATVDAQTAAEAVRAIGQLRAILRGHQAPPLSPEARRRLGRLQTQVRARLPAPVRRHVVVVDCDNADRDADH